MEREDERVEGGNGWTEKVGGREGKEVKGSEGGKKVK